MNRKIHWNNQKAKYQQMQMQIDPGFTNLKPCPGTRANTGSVVRLKADECMHFEWPACFSDDA